MFENQMKLMASSTDFEVLIVQFKSLFRDVYQLFNNRSIQFELWPSMPPQPKRLGGCFMGASGIRSVDWFRRVYLENAILVGDYEFPEIPSQTYIPDVGQIVSLGDVSSNKRLPHCCWIDHFVSDERYASILTKGKFESHYLPIYRKAAGIIGTDFSLLPTMPTAERIISCYLNRCIDYALSKLNIPEIPTASWACMDDFDWCLDGLPMHSTIAVSTNGILSNPNSMNLFINGLHTVQQKLSPSTLLINTTSVKKLESISDVKQYDNILLYSNIGQRRRRGEMNKTVHSQKVLFDLDAINGGNDGR